MSHRRRNKHPHEEQKGEWDAVAEKVKPLLPKDKINHVQFEGGRVSEHTTALSLRTKQIAIGIPLDELMFSQFFVNFELLDKMPWDSMISTTSTYLPDARNKIHNFFLEKDKSGWLLMLDSDVMPPPHLIERLIAHNKDCVGGWYRKKEKYRIELNGQVQIIQRPVVYEQAGIQDGVIQYVQKRFPGEGLEEVAAAGAGCWLMSRNLAEALGKSPYDMGNKGDAGEDMQICRKITAAGFPMFVDWSLACAHIGTFFV
jgi:cellulose synthase/poly-beta-1,6-N-acetylglucosamine synthase-like glycosyltransferase